MPRTTLTRVGLVAVAIVMLSWLAGLLLLGGCGTVGACRVGEAVIAEAEQREASPLGVAIARLVASFACAKKESASKNTH